MTAPRSIPYPVQNQTSAGAIDAVSDVVAADIIVAVGDYTAGAAEDMFTLSAHGLVTGDYLYLLEKSDVGGVTGRVGTQFRAKVLTSSTFQLTTTAAVVIENTADATCIFLKGRQASSSFVQTVLLPRLVVTDGDFATATPLTDDQFTARGSTGYHGLEDTDTLKLLYKAAAGVVTAIAVNTTVYAKTVTTGGYFQVAATSGGAVIENSADGLAVFIKTS